MKTTAHTVDWAAVLLAAPAVIVAAGLTIAGTPWRETLRLSTVTLLLGMIWWYVIMLFRIQKDFRKLRDADQAVQAAAIKLLAIYAAEAAKAQQKAAEAAKETR